MLREATLRTARWVMWAVAVSAQTVYLRPAPVVDLPPVIDGNSAAFWADGQLNLFHSTGVPSISRGPNQFSLGSAGVV